MDTPLPPEFSGEPGWTALNLPRTFGTGRSFVSGDPHGERLRVFYFHREEDEALCAKVWFGADAEGPPGHAHGGSMAAVLDEAMGFACWVAGHPVVAAEINIRFHRRLPLEQVLHVETSIKTVEGKKVRVRGRIFNPENGDSYATGKGLFIRQELDGFGEDGLTTMLKAHKDKFKQP